MNICICGPVNPFELREFITSNTQIISINKGASAVNTYVKELLRCNHNVTVLTSDVPLDIISDITYLGKNLTIYVLSSKPGFFFHHVFSRFYMVNRLRRYLKKLVSKLDVVHCQWTYDYAMAARSIEKKVPVFCTVRDWCPYIKKVQGSLFKKIQWTLYELQFRYVMSSHYINFIANSQYTYNCIQAFYPEKKVPIIFNPIDKELVLFEKNQFPKTPTFISIASSATEKRKNIPILLEAFSMFLHDSPNAKLLLVGGGFQTDNPALTTFKKQGLFHNVELLGTMCHRDVIETIDRSSCLIHPALEESFGNILIEGMARFVPVIGGEKSGAVPMVLDYGNCGILCDITSKESIVEAMRKTLNNDFVSTMVKKANDYVRSTYGSDVILQKHIDLYSNYI